jgi:branched-subunit amino acid transport protein
MSPMANPDYALPMVVATSVLTFAIRYLPLVALREWRPGPRVERMLRALPIGILAALVAQAVFLRDGAFDAGLANHYLPGLVVAMACAARGWHLAAVVFVPLGVVGALTLAG